MKDRNEKTTHVRVFDSDHKRLLSIKAEMGFKNIAWIVRRLLEEQVENLASIETIMNKRVPIVLTGKPLSGKTFFIKHKLLPTLRYNPVLVIDCLNEYEKLRNIGYDIYSVNFRDFNEQVRFVPNTQSMVAETEVESIFAHFYMKKHEMSKWIIIVEEAHAFKNSSVFTKFLYGSRHIVRKMIVVTPHTSAFPGLLTLTILH